MESTYGMVLKFIRTVRESFIGSETVYTKGSCYQFYLILKSVFPTAEAYYDHNHVITKIDDVYYDITGQVLKGNHLRMFESLRDEELTEIEKCKFNIHDK